MTKDADFGPNLAVFGPKILIFMGVSKSFDTHITEKPPGQLILIVFWSGIGKMGQKCQYLAKKNNFEPIWLFKGKNLNLYEG